MKARELLAKLQGFDPELDVLCYCEDVGSLSAGRGFKLLDINDISSGDAEPSRLEDGTPYLKFGKTPDSFPHILIEVTSDF